MKGYISSSEQRKSGLQALLKALYVDVVSFSLATTRAVVLGAQCEVLQVHFNDHFSNGTHLDFTFSTSLLMATYIIYSLQDIEGDAKMHANRGLFDG